MMNKDEAVQKLATVGRMSMSYAEDLYDSFFEKPIVPQYVADWYEGNKEYLEYNLWDYLTSWEQQKGSDFKEWINNENNTFQTLVNMHQFGYEVEKETKYTVKMKSATYRGKSQLLCKEGRDIFWCSAFHCRKIKFTRKELESNGFDWIFDCEGIEIEEVEE